ncbi:DUF1249 domain-containing protein [Pseudomarimonas salicorniae]|uniref:DUF1249 domain-containing protein n=1 Tax=Pseudomarimonas salicorniae TaxID=2933270 RepID=A0ABT0GKX2_9GAMM|nr:DUF1249 domain-containing protein [Lysobacter sp. CAU 1642]MCK7595189.1 DUF1249 domain-containing protein [Lysobacter sp. CAU 1642]
MSSEETSAIRMSRFGFLMGLYAENFLRMERVFGLPEQVGDYLVSSIDDGLDLHLQIIERHPYTLELKLTYGLIDPLTGEPDPSAHLRIYRDARMAEVTHCYAGKRWQDVLGLDAPARTVVGHRLRMNVFLSKWLEYLGDQGHSPFTLRLGSADEILDNKTAQTA